MIDIIKPGIANSKAQIVIEPVPVKVKAMDELMNEEWNQEVFG